MDMIFNTAMILVGLVLGFIIGAPLHRKRLLATFKQAESGAEQIISDAQKERDRIIQEASNEVKNESKQRRTQFEAELNKRRGELAKLETKMTQREQALEKKLTTLDKKEADLEKMTNHINREEIRYKKLIDDSEKSLEQTRKTLESVANLSQEEARRQLIKSMESDAKKAAAEIIKKIEEDAKLEGEKRAQSTVSLAVQRVSSDYVNDSTVTVVTLPTDEMKGRIIGREGRNIRAIEQATGVDLIIDDTPEAVIISCFNPIRREIAKIALERLIADGRIHPARIDETVKRVETDFDQIIIENGEQAAFDTGITDIHPELIRYLGKLKYRTAGMQTVLQHCVEVAHICGIMANEMGIDVKRAKRAGLLHDIGKAVDQEVEGHHSAIGAELLKKFNENPEIIEAVLNHHSEDLSFASPLTVILYTSNVLSANRPGARKEVLETYVKRLENIENMVKSFAGIDSCFVIQAGREIRAMVTPNVSDQDVMSLSNDIAFKLRKEMSFPGQVRVTVLRESRSVEYAK